MIFYMKKITLKNGNVIVSGPSRGIDGFLPVLSYEQTGIITRFPAPREVWVVSYKVNN